MSVWDDARALKKELEAEKAVIAAAREAWGELYMSLMPDHPHHRSTAEAARSAWDILEKALRHYDGTEEPIEDIREQKDG